VNRGKGIIRSCSSPFLTALAREIDQFIGGKGLVDVSAEARPAHRNGWPLIATKPARAGRNSGSQGLRTPCVSFVVSQRQLFCGLLRVRFSLSPGSQAHRPLSRRKGIWLLQHSKFVGATGFCRPKIQQFGCLGMRLGPRSVTAEISQMWVTTRALGLGDSLPELLTANC